MFQQKAAFTNNQLTHKKCTLRPEENRFGSISHYVECRQPSCAYMRSIGYHCDGDFEETAS